MKGKRDEILQNSIKVYILQIEGDWNFLNQFYVLRINTSNILSIVNKTPTKFYIINLSNIIISEFNSLMIFDIGVSDWLNSLDKYSSEKLWLLLLLVILTINLDLRINKDIIFSI